MKEHEFLELYPGDIVIPIYYTLDSKKNVNIDEDSIREVFEEIIKKMRGDLNGR